MDAWEKFKKTVEAGRLLHDGERVILAVSGGPDSVCLLHLFWRLRKTFPVELLVLTMDHGLRKQSSRETRTVQALCEKLAVPVMMRRIAVKEFAAENKVSLETAGRILRYRTLAATAKDTGYKMIATGHTANDNAETVLMWLIRGTGTEGMAGIPLCRKLDETGATQILRPLLSVTRDEVMRYVRRQKLPVCTDASNYSLEYTRNRIRHKVIPLLKEYNPRLVEHLYNLSRILASENEFLSGITARAMKKSVTRGRNRISLDLKRFFEYNRVTQSRILKEILPEKRSLSNVERLLGWILSQSDNEMNLSRSWRIVIKKNTLVFAKID